MADLEAWFREGRAVVDAALESWLPEQPGADRVQDAMRYSLFAGGKRLRPLLAVLTGEAIGFSREQSLPYACALEMVHTYSLIHDDLPAMDNDSLRRGRPTCHVVFGEATAMLAGDCLLTLAFEVLGRAYAGLPAPRLANALITFSQALGIDGMVGGQSLDMASEGKSADLALLRRIHAGKTGALIRASCEGVGHLAGADARSLAVLRAYGASLGLLFQIRDDLLDLDGTAEQLGKTPGKDVAVGKATYPRVLGIDGARRFLDEICAETVGLVAKLPGDRQRFAELAEWAASRGH